MVLFMTIYTDQKFPETREKPINGCERAEIFALLHQIYIMFFLIPTRKPETHEKAINTDCERAKFFAILESETYDSPQYSVDKSHG